MAVPKKKNGESLDEANSPLTVARYLLLEGVEHLRKAARVALLCLGQSLEPLCDVVEAFLTGSLRHARVHGLVLVRLAVDGGLEVLLGRADGKTGSRIADL